MAVDIDELRALVGDEDSNAFTDEALEAAISASADSLLRAAGIAFLSLAATYSAIGRSTRTDDLALDTRSRGKDLAEVAASFFTQATAADATAGADFFSIVPFGGRVSSGICRVEGSPYPVSCCAGTACSDCVL